jgi:hypothetical protein
MRGLLFAGTQEEKGRNRVNVRRSGPGRGDYGDKNRTGQGRTLAEGATTPPPQVTIPPALSHKKTARLLVPDAFCVPYA